MEVGPEGSDSRSSQQPTCLKQAQEPNIRRKHFGNSNPEVCNAGCIQPLVVGWPLLVLLLLCTVPVTAHGAGLQVQSAGEQGYIFDGVVGL
jgi:hypothetical protein